MRFNTSLAIALSALCYGNPAMTGAFAAETTGEASLELNDKQAAAIKVEKIGERNFVVEKEAVGAVDFNQDLAVQLFPPYAGKIIEAYAKLGDDVKKGQVLYSIHSPDLVQAEGTLIGAAATLQLTTHALERAKNLFETQGLAQKDYEQAVSDQQTAEGAFKAARDAVLIFGKNSAEADRVVAERKIDPALVVPSPVNGRVTQRNAQPGLFVQPGTAPAPYSIADLSVLWLTANVTESDSPHLKAGQNVAVSVMAYPGRRFTGKLARIGTSVDPSVHTVTAIAEIQDPAHELRPGMIASFRIETAAPQRSPAVPVNGVVREGDGTMTAWGTTDGRHFQRRIVTIGMQQDGFRQILAGVSAGESLVTDGAVLLSNKAAGGHSND